MLRWGFDQKALKKIRGQRITIEVQEDVGYTDLLNIAECMWKNFQSMSSSESNFKYVLLYENGNLAEFLPGTEKPFILKHTKECY